MNSASVLFDARQNKHILKTLTHLRMLINQFHSERQKAINVLVLIQREFYQFNAFSFVQEYKEFPRARLETVCATAIEKFRRELLNIIESGLEEIYKNVASESTKLGQNWKMLQSNGVSLESIAFRRDLAETLAASQLTQIELWNSLSKDVDADNILSVIDEWEKPRFIRRDV
ncbi:hypothetical protein MP638_005742, partial [Amoeboaphelidium occidentale]